MAFDPNNDGRVSMPRLDQGDYFISICLVSSEEPGAVGQKQHILLEVEK
jgi:hypothetical protein